MFALFCPVSSLLNLLCRTAVSLAAALLRVYQWIKYQLGPFESSYQHTFHQLVLNHRHQQVFLFQRHWLAALSLKKFLILGIWCQLTSGLRSWMHSGDNICLGYRLVGTQRLRRQVTQRKWYCHSSKQTSERCDQSPFLLRSPCLLSGCRQSPTDVLPRPFLYCV